MLMFNLGTAGSTSIRSLSPESVIITGDISEGDDVVFQLNRIAEALMIPIYFVLGNHDFYQSSIGKTRQDVIAATRTNPLLRYLTDCPPVELNEGVFLVGDDGWGDATEGDYEGSPIRLNDFELIEDFRNSDPSNWKAMLQQQGSQSAERVLAKLSMLPASAKEVLVATHVPPFCESCWYEGQTTDENWAPFFVCGSMGKILQTHFAAGSQQRGSQQRGSQQWGSQQKGTVLCGHTHHEGVAKMSDNLIVHTGAAAYGKPDVEATLNLDKARIELVTHRA